jgi:signal recognition particle subunit SRP72
MSATTPLLAGLLKKATIEDHEEILKASSAALKKSRTDVQAQHAHAVALLKQDRYDEALRFIQDCGQPLQERAALEHAFVLYKTGQWEEALNTLEGASGRGAQHLEAQVQYRLENSARVLDIYEEIRSKGCLMRSSTYGSMSELWRHRNSGSVSLCQKGQERMTYSSLRQRTMQHAAA